MPKVLKWATEDVDNPDCRDRGFMYWRLLSTDPATAKKIVLADKPPISTETDRMDRQLLDQLLLHGATLSSIFHRQPQTFIRGAKARYIPDSAALDETARRHASTHIYSKPFAKAPYVTSSSSAPSNQAVAIASASNGNEDSSKDSNGNSNGNGNMLKALTIADNQSEDQQEGQEDGVDPYSMLGDDFGGEGNSGYAADAPAPKSSAIDDLLS